MIKIIIKDYGTLELKLHKEYAPITCNNFLSLVKKGFYNGLIFHRVIKGFMIQGGDPLGVGYGGPGYAIKGEFSSNGIENPLSHKRGVISMARSGNPDSAGSQFFIMHEDGKFLDGQYAAFGEVIDGFEIIDRIAECKTDSADKPLKDVIIEKIEMFDEIVEDFPQIQEK